MLVLGCTHADIQFYCSTPELVTLPPFEIAPGVLMPAASIGAWSGNPISDISCCCHPLTAVPSLRPGPRRAPGHRLQLERRGQRLRGRHKHDGTLAAAGRPRD